MEQNGYPKWKSVQRVVEKAEPAVFKAYFKTWKEPAEQVGLGRVFNERQIAASKFWEYCKSGYLKQKIYDISAQLFVIFGAYLSHEKHLFTKKNDTYHQTKTICI